MAAVLIAEAFFTTLFERIFDMVLSGEVKFGSRKKLNDGMRRKLKTMLLAVNAVLNDAEKKQISDPNVRQWLDELKDTMYKAEDLAYEMETQVLRSKIEGGRSVFHKVSKVFSSGFSVGNVEDRIVDIFHTLEGIVAQKDLLPLRASQGHVHHNKSSSSSSSSSSSPQLLPVEEESDVYGRDHDKAVIVNLLMCDDDHVADDAIKISVISIVGMGGIGKTTLAGLVYNDVSVTKQFDLKAWVTVSDEFDVFTLTKTIFEGITFQKDCGIKHPHQLQFELKKVTEGKKFLFVLDDVWNESYNLWDNLKSQFKFGALGSKIIVTTRSEKIGSMMGGNIPNHYLGILSEENGWKLFSKHAFQNVTDRGEMDQYFEEIGRRIVRKCNGLPLAIKSIGGLLSFRYHVSEWEDILNSETWKLNSNILPALWLSYYYLPPHLKRCFSFCSIFPKDYEFEKEELILLWMAEDLLQPQQNKILEEIGDEYFNDLTSMSFFHRGEYGRFTMHDLVNDLASLVSGEFCFRSNDDDDDDDLKVFTAKTRHLSFIKSASHDVKKLEEYLSRNRVLRTLLFKYGTPEQFLTNLEQYLKGMQHLRVLSLVRSSITKCPVLIGCLKLLRYLDLSYTDIEKLPGAVYTLYNLQTLLFNTCRHFRTLSSLIGNLKHLRYLDMSYCGKLKEIPNTLCDLHDLHTLNLRECESISSLPADMSRLVNLRYLGIFGTKVTEMPQQMCRLKHLQHLSVFFVDKNGGHNIKELGSLRNLTGMLRIKNIENVVNVGDVWEAKLKDKKHITQLELVWNGKREGSEEATEVLDMLQPHTNVQILVIDSYHGTSFPRWIGYHSFSSIVYLCLRNCRNCYLLPPLGQLPSLKNLDIWGLEMVERIGDEFCGTSTTGSSSMVITPPFKSLESLSLRRLRELKEWKDWSMMGGEDRVGAFSQLKTLELANCPNINGECLPSNLPPSTTLIIMDRCDALVASLQSHQLPWLGCLKLKGCSELVSFPPQQGGLPFNIHTLHLERCDKLESLAKHGWPSNLKSLHICACKNMHADVGSFPEEGQLPATLICLELKHLPNLKLLNGKALRHLICLRQLTIVRCKELQCFPEEGLPQSLCELNIKWCHVSLAERCKRDTGEDWPKISHIPRISINI